MMVDRIELGLRDYVILVVSVLFLGLLIESGLSAYSYILSHQSERIENRWINNNGLVDQEAILRANDFVDRSLTLESYNPDLLQLSGRIKIWSLGEASAIHEYQKYIYDLAASDYEKAIKLRPYWPYAYSEYASLVSVWLSLRELSQTERNHLESKLIGLWGKALQYGKNEPEIIRNLLAIGFGNWSTSSWRLKKKTVDLLKASVKKNPLIERVALKVLTKSAYSKVVCDFYKLTDEVPNSFTKLCKL